MQLSATKLSINDNSAIKEHYNSQGYVVVKNVLNSDKIDCFLDCYQKIKRNKLFIYYSQSLHLPIRPQLSSEGFIQESMERPSDLKLFSRFSQSVLNCLVDSNVSKILTAISGEANHKIWSNMFFDKSTGTLEHQDHYYLDTVPSGNLIGAWYALEDIHPDSGCFFVLPGSHKDKVFEPVSSSGDRSLDSTYANHDQMRQEIVDLINQRQYKYEDLTIDRGDMIFWHPYLIHGAYNNRNPKYSRKSFTTHFYPSSYKRSDGNDQFAYKPYAANNNILVKSNNLKLYAWNLKLYWQYCLNQLSRKRPVMDMRRDSYKI